MPAYVQVTAPYVDGDSDDLMVNTITIDTEAVLGLQPLSEAEAQQIADLVEDFYVDVPGPIDFGGSVGVSTPAQSVSAYFSPRVSRSANTCEINVYHLDEAAIAGEPMGSPLVSKLITLTASSDIGLPPITHKALTLEAVGRRTAAVEVGATRPKQRRTGHLKVGPLNVDSMNQAGVGYGRPGQQFIATLMSSAVALHEALGVGERSMGLGVWSRLDAAVRPIEAISCDDSFDYVSSRKENPTTRLRSLVA